MALNEELLTQIQELLEGSRNNLTVTARTQEEVLLADIFTGLKTLADSVDTLNTEQLDLSGISDVSGTDLTAVPGSFADLAAVQSYLSTIIPEIEARLDDIEAKINEILAA